MYNLRNIIFLLVCLQTIKFCYCKETLAKDLKFKLKSGDLMPMVGLGTSRIKEKENVEDVLDKAFAAGYRLIDTAKLYGNEIYIGEALKILLPKHNLTRRDIFITTKLAPEDLGDKAYEALKDSIQKLNTEYVDLYLIHWPGAADNLNNSIKRDKTWELLAKGVKDGLARNIGVSNFNIRHLNQLLKNDFGVRPAVNQVEWHPNYHQDDLKKFLDKEGILLQAYSSLGGSSNDNLRKNEKVKEIGKKLGKSPVQVLLKWSLQQNNAVIPKATSQKHLEENIDLNFVIPEKDMIILNTFSQKKNSWNSEDID
ncbi:unnamed protein product [Brassicogethes aeneus]|uniref:NADP-dependent oxidoreductase domain-containing protein n=1 Tax=Brassicogethes aeneus TaxID=1431903 RepID=A0A9P0AS70_BRAAE|nr:unnamed protein product [Brassicogethes aeneus]